MSAVPYTVQQIDKVLQRIVTSAEEMQQFVSQSEMYCWHDAGVDCGPSLDAVERDIKVVKDMIGSNARHEGNQS